MEQGPSPNGANGGDRVDRGDRGPRGRFASGNRGGPGNPHAKRVAVLRGALLDAVTDEDIHAVARALVAAAKTGEVAAIRELLDRCIGKAAEGADLLERIAALEAVIESRGPVAPAVMDLKNPVLPPRAGKTTTNGEGER